MTHFFSLLAALVLIPSCVLYAEQDSLPPLRDGNAPRTFAELWSGYDPRKEPLEIELLKEWEEDGVVLRVVRFRIGIFKGQKTMLAGVYGFPKGGTQLPGLLQIHGGGQYADCRAPLTNAKRGYATLSIAWAGRISAPGYAVTPDIVQLFWDRKTTHPKYKLTTDWGPLDAYHAPCRNARNQFTNVAPQPWTLDAVESPRNNPWFLCTLGARRGLTFLEQQPEVDRERLGVYGHSMGGKLTVMTAGADARVKAAAPSCGGISDLSADHALYVATLADNVYLKRIACPIIFLSPANDFHGRINDLPGAVREIGSREWRVTCAAHHNHQDTEPYQVAGPLWFDQHLKGTFRFPVTPKSRLELKAENHLPLFSVAPDTSRPVLAVDIYYTQQGQKAGEKNDHYNTMSRFWHYASARSQGRSWVAELPLQDTDRPLWVYANVYYRLDVPVVAAGYYYGVYTATTFNVSSVVTIVSPEELKQAGVKATDKPELLIEAFADGWQKEWFTYDMKGDWPRNTHKLYDPKWKAPVDAKLAIDIRSEQPNKMVFGLDEYAAEVALNGGREWQSVVLVPGDFSNGEEVNLARWGGVRELRLGYKESLRRKANDPNGTPGKNRMLGGNWNGPAPVFRNLRWVVGAETDAPPTSGKPVLQGGIALITDHGAKPDGVTLNTQAIQAAIDACRQAGGGRVVMPAGRFLTGTIRMKDNVTLHLEEGAVLLGSTNLTDYATDVVGAVEAPAFNRCLIYAHQATNIGFSGKGLVDARGTPAAFPEKVGPALGERPMLMRLVECHNVHFKDVSFRNSASWGLHLVSCRDVRFDGIRIDSQGNNINNDGIDLDGCSDVLIENCVIHSGDDAICPKSTTTQPCSNIVVRGCTISSHTAAYKLGTSSRSGFVDMKVSDCRFHDCPMGAIKLLLVDGGRLENVEISNITMENVGGPVFIRLGNRGRVYDKPTEQVYGAGQAPEGASVGVLRHVTIRNIEARVTGTQRDRQGIMITGIPGHCIENATLENIKLSLPGGGTKEDAARVVPEDVARYPEQFFFGILPSSVLYARHVKGLVVRNLDVTFDTADARPALYREDVEGLTCEAVRVNGKDWK